LYRKLASGVYYVGVDDHHTELFENLWKLPYGVSYNSYLIVDEKVALIETVKGPWADEWLDNIRELVDPAKIDYIILNHMEPDHTGALPDIARIAKNATLVYTPRASDMRKSFYDVDLNEKKVEDLEELSLGKKTLKFVHIPFVHWPETMATWIAEDGILFSCDAFGAFGALNGKHFDDEANMELVEGESRRYVSVIITSYFKFVQNAIKKVKDLGLNIKIIAPSHGVIYRKNPNWVISKYDEWSSPKLDKYCAIVYGTMYGYTHRLAMKLKKELVDLGIEVKMDNVSYSDIGDIITKTVRAGVIVIGAPTYDAFPFPKVWTYVNELQGKRFAPRPVGFFGTFGWGGGALEKLQKTAEEMKWEVLGPVIKVRGRPSQEETEMVKTLAKTIASKLG